MCYKCDEDKWDTVDLCDQPDAHQICDDFSYVLSRFNIVDKTPRNFWAGCLAILHEFGSEQVREHEREFFEDGYE